MFYRVWCYENAIKQIKRQIVNTIKIELDINQFVFLFKKDDRRNIRLQTATLKVDIRGNQFDVSFTLVALSNPN